MDKKMNEYQRTAICPVNTILISLDCKTMKVSLDFKTMKESIIPVQWKYII